MNPKSFNKIIKSIESCLTREQLQSCWRWIHDIKRLYKFSGRQKSQLSRSLNKKSLDLICLD